MLWAAVVSLSALGRSGLAAATGAPRGADAAAVTSALGVTVKVEAEALLDVTRDGTIVRVRSNANPPDYRATVLCAYTFSDAPCAVTREMLDQLETLPLRLRSMDGTVYP